MRRARPADRGGPVRREPGAGAGAARRVRGGQDRAAGLPSRPGIGLPGGACGRSSRPGIPAYREHSQGYSLKMLPVGTGAPGRGTSSATADPARLSRPRSKPRLRLPAITRMGGDEQTWSQHGPEMTCTRGPGTGIVPGQNGLDGRVRRQGPEPRTRSLRVRCSVRFFSPNCCRAMTVHAAACRRCRVLPGRTGTSEQTWSKHRRA